MEGQGCGRDNIDHFAVADEKRMKDLIMMSKSEVVIINWCGDGIDMFVVV